MNDLSKESQLKKNRKVNLKKMTKIEYNLYVVFVNDKSYGLCQSRCGRKSNDIHHSYFGAGGRDDRYITAICRECHTTIHHGTNVDEASRLKLLFKGIGKQNWRDYNE